MRLPLAFTAALVLLAVPLVAAHRANPSDAVVNDHSAERDDLERAARDYRIAVYRGFRQNRAEFDRRNAVWRDMYARWKRDGENDAESAMLVDWLRQATIASRAGAVQPLPPSPSPGVRPTNTGNVASNDIPSAEPSLPRTLPPDASPPVVEPPVVPLARHDGGSSPIVRRADAGELPSVALPISPSLQPPQRNDVADIENVESVAEGIPRRSAPAVPIDPPSLPPETEVPTTDSPRESNAGVDVGEIAIRVAGHNLALATLAEEIRQANEPSIDRLVSFVERLESQAVRASDLTPYFSLVDASERGRLQSLASADDARLLLLSRIAQVIALWTSDATVSSARRTEQLSRLEELQRRVNRLSATP